MLEKVHILELDTAFMTHVDVKQNVQNHFQHLTNQNPTAEIFKKGNNQL